MPHWAKNGKQLFFRWYAYQYVVDVQTDGGFATGKPQLLFENSQYEGGGPIRTYDLSCDGQRFLMVKHDPWKTMPATEIVLVQNGFEEIKRLCPIGKE
jgi:hypothetical protein